MRRDRALATLLAAVFSIGPGLGTAAAQIEGTSEGTSSVSERASFALAYHGHVVPWRQFLLRAVPGEQVVLEVRAAAEALGAPPGVATSVPTGAYAALATAGTIMRTAPSTWTWTAPAQPGLYRVAVRRVTDRPAGAGAVAADSIVLTAAVLVPMSELRGERMRAYRIGRYPEEVFRGLQRYERPRGLIRVTPDDVDVPVSPRFQLGQFSVKRPDEWPRYTALHERLLLKMELLVEHAERRGVPAHGWKVLSAFRSPWYNRSIGRPQFSRHIFGDAADLFVDVTGDGRMDDLNGDGRVDVIDAKVLYDIVDRMDEDPALQSLIGGLGRYRATSARGPFIHVDTRGYRARW